VFVNKTKNKNYSEKEKEKYKENMNEKKENENVTDSTGSKKKHLMSNPTQMKYNAVEDFCKLRTTLPFT
jgi:hypothetical protein